MTIGPAPMIRMLLMSVRLGIGQGFFGAVAAGVAHLLASVACSAWACDALMSSIFGGPFAPTGPALKRSMSARSAALRLAVGDGGAGLPATPAATVSRRWPTRRLPT